MPLSSKIEQLQTALLYCTIGRGLRRAAYASIGWGALCLVIGVGISIWRTFDYVDIAFGAALIIEGLYLIYSNKPITVVVEAVTLALLCIWNVLGFVLAYTSGHKIVGNPLVTIVLGIGAWNMFATYRTYKLVSEKADPDAVRVCREQLDKISNADSSDVVSMQSDKPLESDELWVASFADDLVLFVNGPRKSFRKKVNASTGTWLLRSDIRVENAGEAWMGKSVKARLFVGEHEFLKVKVAPEEFERLQTLLLRGPQAVHSFAADPTTQS